MTMIKNLHLTALFAIGLCLSGAVTADSRPAEPATARANAAVLQQLDFSDDQAFADARRGFIAAAQDPLLNSGGSTASYMDACDCLEQFALATANTSRCRQSHRNAIDGLIQVVEFISMVGRWYLAYLTTNEGPTGLIVI